MSSVRASAKLEGIQSLRAVAAFMVVGRHFIHAVQNQKLAPGLAEVVHRRDWLAFGQAGVDFFFVISGFIIMYVTPRPLASWKDIGTFLVRRMARIYPAYWAAFFVLLAWRCWKARGGEGLPDNSELISWIFLLPYVHLPPVVVAWTLVYEIHFYVVSALIFIAPQRIRTYLALAWLLLVLAVNIPIWDRAHWSLFAQFYLSPFPLEFIAGLFIAYALRHRPYPLGQRSAVILGLLALTSIPVLGSLLDVDGSIGQRVAAYAPAAVAIVWVVVQMDAQGHWSRFNTLAWLGDRSYSLYLLHTPVLTAAMEFGTRILPRPGVFGLGVISVFACMALGVLVELSYRFIEKPAQNAAKRIAPHTELAGPSRLPA